MTPTSYGLTSELNAKESSMNLEILLKLLQNGGNTIELL